MMDFLKYLKYILLLCCVTYDAKLCSPITEEGIRRLLQEEQSTGSGVQTGQR